jgi:hypothetical protein
MKSLFRLPIFIFLAVSSVVFAQTPIQINIALTPPYSPYLNDYINFTGSFGTVTNTSGATLRVKFRGKLMGDNGYFLKTKDDFQPPQPVIFNQFESKTITKVNVKQFYFMNQSAIETNVTNADAANIAKDGVLPEGNYTYCLQAFDYDTDQPLSMGEPVGCASFSISYVKPPVAIAPTCEDTIYVPFFGKIQPIFSWSPPLGNVAGANIRYDLYIVKLAAGQDPQVAMEQAIPSGAGAFFIKKDISTNSYSYNQPINPPMQVGFTYVWAIQARDSKKSVFFENDGISEICSFTTRQQTTTTFISSGDYVTNYFPKSNDTLPFTQMPIIVQLTDLTPDFYTQFDFPNTTIKDETTGNEIYSLPATPPASNYWPTGPWANLKITYPQATSQEAHLLAINLRGMYPIFERGHQYSWTSGGHIQTHNGLLKNYGLNTNSNIEIGMPTPRLTFPANEAKIKPGDLTFNFNTGNGCQKPLPEFRLDKIDPATKKPSFISKVEEAWVLEVSKKADFSEIYKLQSDKIEQEIKEDPNTRAYDVNALNETVLNKKIDYLFKSFTEEGTYYWRVVYLKNPLASFTAANPPATGDFYRESPINKFTISKDGVNGSGGGNGGGPPMANCGECSMPEPQNLTPRTAFTFNEGDKIKVGTFEMELMTISKQPDAQGKFSGEGRIPFPILNWNFFRLKVVFTDIQVNAQNVMIAGQVLGMKNTSGVASLLPDFDANRVKPTDAAELFNYLTNPGNLLDAANQGLGFQVPFGYEENGHKVALTKFVFTPRFAYYDAAVIVDLPEPTNVDLKIALEARRVCFKNDNVFCGDAIFVLTAPFDVAIGNNPDQHIISLCGTPNINPASPLVEQATYMVMKKFKVDTLNICASYTFPLSAIHKVDDVNGKIVAVVKGKGTSWDNWKAAVTMTNFRVTDYPDYIFKAANGKPQIEFWYDHSCNSNPNGMPDELLYPTKQGSPLKKPIIGGNTWQGFWTAGLTMEFPAFIKNSNKIPVQTTITNVVMDRMGFSGGLNINNLLVLDQGDLDGWFYSIDNVNINFLNNALQTAHMDGRLILPVCGNATNNPGAQLNYVCNFSNTDIEEIDPVTQKKTKKTKTAYEFGIQLKDDLDMSVWIAHAQILGSSRVAVEVSKTGDDGYEVKALADMNGVISIKGQVDPVGLVDLKLLAFEHMRVQTKKPFIEIGKFTSAFASPQKSMGGFDVSFSELDMYNQDAGDGRQKVGFKFDVTVKLLDLECLPTGKIDDFSIYALAGMKDGRPDFTFGGVDVEGIAVKGKMAGVLELDGNLRFLKSDSKFGSGVFAGITVKVIDKFTISAATLFAVKKEGATDKFICAIDLNAAGLNIPLGGIFSLDGIGGSFYYNIAEGTMPAANLLATKTLTYDEFAARYNVSSGTIGLAARVIMQSTDGTLFRAAAEFRIQMKTEPGFRVDWIKFKVDGAFFAEKGATSFDNAIVKASGEILLDFSNELFSANFSVTMNASDIVKGAGTMYFEINGIAKTWKFLLGEPTPVNKRVLVSVLNLATLSAYIDAGFGIPGMPPPPDGLVDVFQACGLQWPATRSGNFTSGDGVCLGAMLSLTPDSKKKRFDFLCFFMEAGGGIGFDVSMMKVKEGCNGLPPEQVGINGWYANGQFYAWVDFAAGIHVDVVFAKGDFKILEAKAGVLMRAGLPKPEWFKGWVSGQFSILNGLVSGTMNFKMSIGSECSQGGVFGGLPIINEILPRDGNKDVSIIADPKVSFNLPVGYDFIFPQFDDDGKVTEHKYKIEVEQFQMKNLNSGAVEYSYVAEGSASGIKYGMNMSEASKLASFIQSERALNPQTEYEAFVKVRVFEYLNGVKTRLSIPENDLIKTSRFKTGDCIDQITDELFVGSYPYPKQRFFLNNESREGFIRLKMNVPCLFDDPKADLKLVIGAIGNLMVPIEPSFGQATGYYEWFGLNANGPPTVIKTSIYHEINYRIPDLPANLIGYHISLVKRPKPVANQVNQTINVERVNQWSSTETNGQAATVTNVGNFSEGNSTGGSQSAATSYYVQNQGSNQQLVAAETQTSKNDVRLFRYYFLKSKYATLAEKLQSGFTRDVSKIQTMPLDANMWWNPDSKCPVNDYQFDEGFDSYDINGVSWVKDGRRYDYFPLIGAIENAASNSYRMGPIKTMYKHYMTFGAQANSAWNQSGSLDNSRVRWVDYPIPETVTTQIWSYDDNLSALFTTDRNSPPKPLRVAYYGRGAYYHDWLTIREYLFSQGYSESNGYKPGWSLFFDDKEYENQENAKKQAIDYFIKGQFPEPIYVTYAGPSGLNFNVDMKFLKPSLDQYGSGWRIDLLPTSHSLPFMRPNN